jgi:hypothetical protein
MTETATPAKKTAKKAPVKKKPAAATKPKPRDPDRVLESVLAPFKLEDGKPSASLSRSPT